MMKLSHSERLAALNEMYGEKVSGPEALQAYPFEYGLNEATMAGGESAQRQGQVSGVNTAEDAEPWGPEKDYYRARQELVLSLLARSRGRGVLPEVAGD